MSRLSKLTDLFQEGKCAAVRTAAGSEMPIWINKLSPFENEQCNHEGRIARARMMLAIREVGTPEADLFEAGASSAKPDAIVQALLATKANEQLVKVIRELHSDPDWKPKLEILEWSSEQIAALAEDDPQVQVMTKVLNEYQAEIDSRTQHLRDELREELRGLSEPDLREQYLESYIEEQGVRAFTLEQQKSQVFYALRRCEGTDHGEHTWTHENCDHSQRWLEDRSEVDQLPELLLTQIRAAYESLNMPADVARFSEGPASSSASSGPSSKQEDSAGSGQGETSDAPAGTSSSPSTKD
jgi:hypothetical protein